MFEDVITVPASADGKTKAKKLANQTVPKEGKLCDLWSAFQEHSKLYMAHHSIAKWQRHCHGRCLETFRDGDLVIETDFAEKYTHQSYISMMMPVYPQTTLMVAIVHFSPQTHVGGGRVHVTETWIFASEDMSHDCDFHLHGLARMADHYLRGEGNEATAAARKVGRTPRIHMFTDGCGKQYKGRRNFRFLADSVRQIGFFIDHHFAATSHFKGCHDGIGGVAKNAMRRREQFGKRIMGADGVVSFLRSFFREKAGSEGEEGMRKYFAKWSPYRMRRVHVEFIGKNEIYRPNSTLEGIEGTRDMYHFAGANIPVCDGSSTTEGGLEGEYKLVLKSREKGKGRLSRAEKTRLEGLGEVKVLDALASRWESEGGPVPGQSEELIVCRKVARTYKLRTRLASCFCSSCQRSEYEKCYVNQAYPRLVPVMQDGHVTERVVMNTGVAPAGADVSQGISFERYKKECMVQRITGTQWEERDSETARQIWQELGREEEPNIIARIGRWAGF